MPALLPVQGVARVVVRGTAQGQQCVNVFHFRNGAAGAPGFTQTGIQGLANKVATEYSALFRPLMNGNWSGDDVTATDLTSIISPVASSVLTGTGGIVSATFPQSVAACITWLIPRHYRGGHPRTYIGPLGASSCESSVSFTSAFVASMTTAAQNFRANVFATPIDGQNMTLCTVHRTYNKGTLSPPVVSEITGAFVDSRIDTMRRRLGPDR
jgi:hypothetical protein